MSSGLIRQGGLAGMVGGTLWAPTPLRQPLLGGRFPEHPVFRPYNLALLVIVVLLAAGLLALRARYKGSYGRLGAAGVVVVFVGYAMMFFGSLPAVVLSPEGSRGLIQAGQDLGFLGALVAGLGAVPLGIALLRARSAPRAGAAAAHRRPPGRHRRRDHRVRRGLREHRGASADGPVRGSLDSPRRSALVAGGATTEQPSRAI